MDRRNKAAPIEAPRPQCSQHTPCRLQSQCSARNFLTLLPKKPVQHNVGSNPSPKGVRQQILVCHVFLGGSRVDDLAHGRELYIIRLRKRQWRATPC